MGDTSTDQLLEGLARVCARAGLDTPAGLTRLTGGATMESWRFEAGAGAYVLRRAPSLEFMEGRPFGHDVEAAVIRAAKAAGVTAPVVVAELRPEDGIGSGFVMEALSGTPNPKEILEGPDPDRLIAECAANLAKIHTLCVEDVPDEVPVMDYRGAIAELKSQFEEAGGDRPIIALGLKWMEDNCPDPIEPVLIHGDYRMGNLLVDQEGWLTGVLDWELAHLGDYHEDLAFGCMAVWRFHRYDRPALGLSDLETYFDAYQVNGGRKVDAKRFRYWLIHRTVWWALGCLRMAKIWRSGEDRMLERVVISRRTSEQELDLLMLLEEDLSASERGKKFEYFPLEESQEDGEAIDWEILVAVSEWLETLKGKIEGHDRFQLAVARNALGIAKRAQWNYGWDLFFSEDDSKSILKGELTLEDFDVTRMKRFLLKKVEIDSPKYPALTAARERWTKSVTPAKAGF
ncbi:tyrosine protein kinase [Erythrobacter longus]|uniref:Tyrosine protein kinase n=1 Tax=Erythrobacter longus TaxID=1044 RepID=A0A074M7L4_ERYLO|nr:phosphotransferase family protein [Erythrobacter longus]KEO88705.1 tyrosine protein kinase [Erythrobacter longus]